MAKCHGCPREMVHRAQPIGSIVLMNLQDRDPRLGLLLNRSKEAIAVTGLDGS